MKLSDISYELLLILRAGYIADDERIDSRLLDQLIKQYRVEYIKDLNRTSKMIPESFVQECNLGLSNVEYSGRTILETTDKIPDIVIGKFGPMVVGIYSPYVDEFSYTVVNRNQLRYSGNGRFNSGILFVSYFNEKLKFKSQDSGFNLLSDIDVAAVWADPSIVPGFDEELDDFPLDEECVNYIKEALVKNDFKQFLLLPSDESNDSDGDELIKNGK